MCVCEGGGWGRGGEDDDDEQAHFKYPQIKVILWCVSWGGGVVVGDILPLSYEGTLYP